MVTHPVQSNTLTKPKRWRKCFLWKFSTRGAQRAQPKNSVCSEKRCSKCLNVLTNIKPANTHDPRRSLPVSLPHVSQFDSGTTQLMFQFLWYVETGIRSWHLATQRPFQVCRVPALRSLQRCQWAPLALPLKMNEKGPKKRDDAFTF